MNTQVPTMKLFGPYRASEDKVRFPKNATRKEQFKAISTLNYGHGFMIEGGQLGQLREGLLDGSDALPSLKTDEAVAYIDRIIAVLEEGFKQDDREYMRRVFARLGFFVFFGLSIWGLFNVAPIMISLSKSLGV